MTVDAPLFVPSDVESKPTTRYMRHLNTVHGLNLASYQQLYHWSTANLDTFWSAVWDTTNVIGYKGSHVVDATASPTDNPSWYVCFVTLRVLRVPRSAGSPIAG